MRRAKLHSWPCHVYSASSIVDCCFHLLAYLASETWCDGSFWALICISVLWPHHKFIFWKTSTSIKHETTWKLGNYNEKDCRTVFLPKLYAIRPGGSCNVSKWLYMEDRNDFYMNLTLSTGRCCAVSFTIHHRVNVKDPTYYATFSLKITVFLQTQPTIISMVLYL